MSHYPAKLAVVVPDIVNVDAEPHSLVYLNAFAVLKIERAGRGFNFAEVRALDEEGTNSAAMLRALTSELDEDATLAGYRLDCVVDALVRVPCGEPEDIRCKPALQRLQAVLANEVQDAAWFDRERHRSLEVLAGEYDLPAEWHRPARQAYTNKVERELSARAQCVWLSIAHEWLSPDELRRAIADYDQWRTAHSIA